jgi:sn-1 stearoyl-lipid 9-desaturase
VFRIYNVLGYVIVAAALLAGTFLFPLQGNYLLSFGVTFGYYVLVWFLAGIYLGDVVHLGLAHRAMDVKPWFIYLSAALNNTIGCFLNGSTWSNRHRLHHLYSDREGDPNKREDDGFWTTFYRSQVPYPAITDTLKEPIFKSRLFRFFNNWYYALFSQISSLGLLWLLVRNWGFALTVWLGIRLIAAYIHWVQNYWAHERKFGTRRYDDDDNAMNIDNILPVLLTFSACLQNNHHHSPRFIRLSHSDDEFDWGFITVRWLYRLGLVKPTESGLEIPDGATFKEVDL